VLPTTQWAATMPDDVLAHAPVKAAWRKQAGQAVHVFTHFRLTLDVYVTHLPKYPRVTGEWVAISALAEAGLPSVFVKALDVGLRA
jgi:A/G-specific adenine glycosylase